MNEPSYAGRNSDGGIFKTSDIKYWMTTGRFNIIFFLKVIWWNELFIFWHFFGGVTQFIEVLYKNCNTINLRKENYSMRFCNLSRKVVVFNRLTMSQCKNCQWHCKNGLVYMTGLQRLIWGITGKLFSCFSCISTLAVEIHSTLRGYYKQRLYTRLLLPIQFESLLMVLYCQHML